jgi:hypothetical protein
MNFNYVEAFGSESPEAYERLLLDAMIGDSTLFTRSDEVETSWALMNPILQGWELLGSPVHEYVGGAGSRCFARVHWCVGAELATIVVNKRKFHGARHRWIGSKDAAVSNFVV